MNEQESIEHNIEFKKRYPKAHWFKTCKAYLMFDRMCHDCCTFNVDYIGNNTITQESQS